MKHKLMIVVEDTGGINFKIYLTGDKARLGVVAPDELTPAEYWANELFQICVGLVNATNGDDMLHSSEIH